MYHSYPNLSWLWRGASGAGVGADAPRKEWVLPGPCLQHCWPWLADAQRASALSLGSSTGCSYTCWRCPSCTVQETQELNVNWANSSTGISKGPNLAVLPSHVCKDLVSGLTTEAPVSGKTDSLAVPERLGTQEGLGSLSFKTKQKNNPQKNQIKNI